MRAFLLSGTNPALPINYFKQTTVFKQAIFVFLQQYFNFHIHNATFGYIISSSR